jgi:hypothetical protein
MLFFVKPDDMHFPLAVVKGITPSGLHDTAKDRLGNQDAGAGLKTFHVS